MFVNVAILDKLGDTVRFRCRRAVDQRIEKTYTDLQSSMRHLLGSSEWDNISVQSLCRKAGVSRSTFYTHFTDKDDLLDSLLELFEQAMLTVNNGRSIKSTGTFKFLPVLLVHVSDNHSLFYKNNSTPGGYPVASRFKCLVHKLVKAELEEVQGANGVDLSLIHI